MTARGATAEMEGFDGVRPDRTARPVEGALKMWLFESGLPLPLGSPFDAAGKRVAIEASP